MNSNMAMSAKRRQSMFRNFPHNVPNVEAKSPRTVKARRLSRKAKKKDNENTKTTDAATMLRVTEDKDIE